MIRANSVALLALALSAATAAEEGPVEDDVCLAGSPGCDDHVSLMQLKAKVGRQGRELKGVAIHAKDAEQTTVLSNIPGALEPTVAAGPDAVVWGDFSLKKCAAEFIAMTIFVFIGCGSAMSVAKEPGSAWVLQVSLTFGFAITVLAYAIGHYSGGQINCAVTFGLVLLGKVSVAQGLGNLAAQLVGSMVGAAILLFMYGRTSTGKTMDKTGGLGTNGVSEGWSIPSVLVGEFIGTFVLMYVVLETAINPDNAGNAAIAPLAIGLTVFLAHSVLVPIDGCSINPARSFGPSVVSMIDDTAAVMQLWIFCVGPRAGAAAAAGVYEFMGKA